MLIHDAFQARTVGAPVEYRVLVPDDHRAGESLPLVLHLHAALSSSESLERAAPLYATLPRAVVACPSTPTAGGFYLGEWEALAAHEFPQHVADRFGPVTTTAVLGASMGGFGALRIAFAQPDRFVAVAALSPAVFPGEGDGVPERNRPSVLGELHRAMGADSVQARARAHAAAIRLAAPRILLDCGAEDEFLLHEGAEHLHGVLDALDIEHTFRLVPGARHVDGHTEERTAEAIRFIGAALSPARPPAPGS